MRIRRSKNASLTHKNLLIRTILAFKHLSDDIFLECTEIMHPYATYVTLYPIAK